LFQDFATNIRFLVALPLLILAERVIDPRLRHATRHFVTSNLVTTNLLPAYKDIILRTRALRDSPFATAALIFLAVAPSLGKKPSPINASLIEGIGLAGAWFTFVSMPLFRLLMLRWAWVLLVWTIFLRRVTRLPLYCVASHPDGAAGLGFLAHTQVFFGVVSFAASAVAAGGLANMIVHQGRSVASLKFLAIGFWVLVVILIAAPLMALSSKLLAVKSSGLFQHGMLGSAYSQGFEEKWLRGKLPDNESLLGSPDIQSLTDLSNAFANIRNMKIFLLDKRIFLWLATPPAIPLLIVAVAITPSDEIVRSVLSLF